MKVFSLATKALIHETPEIVEVKTPHCPFLNLIHVQSESFLDAARMAVMAKDASSSFEVLKYSDFKNQIKSVEHLKRFGNFVILVERLSDLSSEHLKIISEYVSETTPSNKLPTFVTHSFVAVEELQEDSYSEMNSFLELADQVTFCSQETALDDVEDFLDQRASMINTLEVYHSASTEKEIC